MTYVIATGYTGNREFLDLWLANTRRYTCPVRIVIIAAAPLEPLDGVCVIPVDNLGHVHDMPANRRIGGWSAGFMLGCLYAYHHNADLIYKEGDCLAFGPWVDQLYREIGHFGAIMGRKNKGPGIDSFYGQSLCLIRYDCLLDFLAAYVTQKESDKTLLPERKFEAIVKQGIMTHMSFGYDRTKPFNTEDPVFYTQQLSCEEIRLLQQKGLL